MDDRSSLLEGGQAAIASGRWSDAAESFRALLELEEDADAMFGLGIASFGLGIASFWLGETRAAMRLWEQAYVAYRRRPDPARAAFAAIYLSLASRMSLGNLAAASGWLGRAARIVTDHEIGELQGWVLLCRADVAIDTGRPAAAEAWAREAADHARAAGDVDLELCALSELGAALVEQGHVDEGTELLDEAMAGALAGEGLDFDSVVLISGRTIMACSRGGDQTNHCRATRRRSGHPPAYSRVAQLVLLRA